VPSAGADTQQLARTDEAGSDDHGGNATHVDLVQQLIGFGAHIAKGVVHGAAKHLKLGAQQVKHKHGILCGRPTRGTDLCDNHGRHPQKVKRTTKV